eukprot:scaffold4066_cov417-Prasinococcus_capsulatus_cf.AAC.19
MANHVGGGRSCDSLFENPNFLFHNESSYSNGEGFPYYLSFCCHAAPKVKGSTLVVDGRAVLRRLRQEVLAHKRVHWVTTVERDTVLEMCRGSPEQFGHTVADWRERILEFHGMPLLHDSGDSRIVFERVYRDIATKHPNGDQTFVGHPEHWFIGKVQSFFGFPKSVEPYGFVYGEAGKLISLFELLDGVLLLSLATRRHAATRQSAGGAFRLEWVGKERDRSSYPNVRVKRQGELPASISLPECPERNIYVLQIEST